MTSIRFVENAAQIECASVCVSRLNAHSKNANYSTENGARFIVSRSIRLLAAPATSCNRFFYRPFSGLSSHNTQAERTHAHHASTAKIPYMLFGCTNLGQDKNGIAGAQKESVSNRNSSACSIRNSLMCKVCSRYLYCMYGECLCVCVKALSVFAEPKQCCGKANYLHKSHGLLILFLVSRVEKKGKKRTACARSPKWLQSTTQWESDGAKKCHRRPGFH